MANLFDVYNDGSLIDHTEGEKLETGETPITITGLTAYTTYDKVQVAFAGSYNKADVPSFKTSPGRNLIIRTGELVGKMIDIDGKVSVNENTIVTRAIIKVTPGEPLTMSGVGTEFDENFRYAFYDEAGNTLIRDYTPLMPAKTVIAPAKAATFRISYPKESQVKLERGSKATPWIPAPEDAIS